MRPAIGGMTVLRPDGDRAFRGALMRRRQQMCRWTNQYIDIRVRVIGGERIDHGQGLHIAVHLPVSCCQLARHVLLPVRGCQLVAVSTRGSKRRLRACKPLRPVARARRGLESKR